MSLFAAHGHFHNDPVAPLQLITLTRTSVLAANRHFSAVRLLLFSIHSYENMCKALYAASGWITENKEIWSRKTVESLTFVFTFDLPKQRM